MNYDNNPSIGATVLGYPRIGRRRELKKALESYWAGRSALGELEATAQAIRLDALATMSAAGLDSIPVNTFSFYDHVLDTTVMLGAVPPRFNDVTGTDALYGFDAYRYFAMARGTARVAPLEMTKWFDTNYHYLVPEIGPQSTFSADPTKPLAEHAEAAAMGANPRPVLVGPFTYLALAKPPAEDSGYDPLGRLGELTEVYVELLQSFCDAGVNWVQLDEPAMVKDLPADRLADVERCYARLAAVSQRPSLFVATYFAPPVEAFSALARAGVEAIGLDLTRGAGPELAVGLDLDQTVLVLGAVGARNVWRTDLSLAERRLREWAGVGAQRAVSSSCSLMHVPYDVADEQGLPKSLHGRLAFADQKLDEVVWLQRVLDGGPEVPSAAGDRAEVVREARALTNSRVQARLAALTPDDRRRPARADRRLVQAKRLSLPPLPTTTIGSFPQTGEIRQARADHRAGRIDGDAYVEAMRNEVARVIELQERLGLDVLVHGEPERNDMVQYFAEQLEGYAATDHGWVQSYGSRCVRPPILFGDVERRQPMTVAWTAYAQGLTSKPVKGVLTGPVTMLAWSFVRDDQPLATTADQVALALREETLDLEKQGVPIIQVDEPAFRESLPLRAAEQDAYLAWATDAFRLATSGVSDAVQVHTHLCYSEFGEIVEAIDRLDADVTSIEAARSSMELLAAISDSGLGGDIGPGVYDIHSPRVPYTAEIVDLLRRALLVVPRECLWVNPDCGLKTRNYSETVRSLAHLVEAASLVRTELGC